MCHNRKALDMLSETKTIFIEEGIFHLDLWHGIVERSAEASEYLIIIFDRPVSGIIWNQVMAELVSKSFNPTFLPKLEVLVGTRSVSPEALHKNRPFKFIYMYEDIDSRLKPRGVHIFQTYSHGYKKYFGRPRSPPNGLTRLNITFDPFPLELSDSVVHTVVTGLYESFPQLECAQIGSSTTWNRHRGPLEGSQDSLPLWTPEPDYFSIYWWVDVLHLSFPGTWTEEEAEHIAEQLRDTMARRYLRGRVLSTEYLVARLLNRSVRDVSPFDPVYNPYR
ncbi:hypothetical protein B0J17DRAFT_633995 [Rhizoctonia solani]|nr:hypothetical protein B0J17DRAFT_633995 [Rhizoctonia solani]